jgi:hypothetical protein
MEQESYGGPRGLKGPLTGTWHLVDARADEMNVPQHRVDLVLRGEAHQLSGAVLSRFDGQEMLALDNVTFDGEVLRLQMHAHAGTIRAEMPFLVMRAKDDSLEGHWMQNGTAVGPLLKLVRSRT